MTTGPQRGPESRLSIERCRALLGNDGDALSDSELEALRDQFYAIASVASRAYLARDASPFRTALLRLSEADRIDVEERAAILEFEGKLCRDLAERQALGQRLGPPKPS